MSPRAIQFIAKNAESHSKRIRDWFGVFVSMINNSKSQLSFVKQDYSLLLFFFSFLGSECKDPLIKLMSIIFSEHKLILTFWMSILLSTGLRITNGKIDYKSFIILYKMKVLLPRLVFLTSLIITTTQLASIFRQERLVRKKKYDVIDLVLQTPPHNKVGSRDLWLESNLSYAFLYICVVKEYFIKEIKNRIALFFYICLLGMFFDKNCHLS